MGPMPVEVLADDARVLAYFAKAYGLSAALKKEKAIEGFEEER